MYYISARPNEGGNYGNPQSHPSGEVYALPDELLSDYIACMGFALLTIGEDGETVTAVTANAEALEAWRAEHPDNPEPEPEPTETDKLRADVDFLLAMGGYIE